MDIITSILSSSITILSLGLLLVSLTSYCKSKNLKLLVVSLVFFLFLCKGVFLSLSMFFSDILSLQYDPLLAALDVGMLLLLFIATMKR